MSTSMLYDGFSSGFSVCTSGSFGCSPSFGMSSHTAAVSSCTMNNANIAPALCARDVSASQSNSLFRSSSSTSNSIAVFEEQTSNGLAEELERFTPNAFTNMDATDGDGNVVQESLNETFGSQAISYSLSTSSSSSSPSSPFTVCSPSEVASLDHSPGAALSPDGNASSEAGNKKKKRHPWKGRLASQRSYDARRRVQFRSLYEQLRDTLRSAEVVSESAQNWLKEDAADGQNPGKEEKGQINGKKGRKKEKKSVYDKKAEQCSTIDLIYVASNLIRQLNGTKDILEKKLAVLTSNEKKEQETVIKQEESKKKRSVDCVTATERVSSAAERNDEIPATKRARVEDRVTNSSGQLVVRSDDAKDLNEIESLLHSIALVTKRYSEDIAIVRARESALPRFIHQLQQYFPCFTLVGMDARILMSNAMRVWKRTQILRNASPWQRDDICKYMENKTFRKWMHKLFRAPHMIQLHALSTLLTQGFHYQPEDAKSMEWVEELLQSEDPQQLEPQHAAQIFQFILHTLPNTNNTTASQHSHLAPLLTHAPTAASDAHSASASVSASPAPASAPAPALSTSASASASTPVPAAVPSEAMVNKSHPLAQFALPASSFQLLLQTLANFVSLGEKEFNRVYNQLSPLAYSSFPFDYPSTIPLPFLRLPEDGNRPCSARDFAFSRMNQLTYEDVCNFFALYKGDKSMVKLKTHRMLTNGFIRGMETDVSIIRDEETGLPMAHLSFPRKVFMINMASGVVEKEERIG